MATEVETPGTYIAEPNIGQPTPKAYLEQLGGRCWSDPSRLTCRELVAIFRHQYGLQIVGVSAERLVRLHREYARRVDELGPEHFDLLASGHSD